jgi:hypothetical protein
MRYRITWRGTLLGIAGGAVGLVGLLAIGNRGGAPGALLEASAWADSKAVPPDAGAAPAPAVPDGGAVPLAPAPPATSPLLGGYPPDPSPLRTRHQWIITLAYRDGVASLRGARSIELPQAASTARNVGRFALELYVGNELLDRVRFEFPLLGADEFAGLRRPWDAPPTFERHLSTSTAVMMPRNERATRLLLVDRASGQTWSLPYPPDQPRPLADGGARTTSPDGAAPPSSPPHP